MGVIFPGCPETFEESQQQGQGRSSDQSFREQDRHQKVRHVREGDILAIPAGVASWTYNDGDSELVSVSLLDTSNYENQLDQNPRVINFIFLLSIFHFGFPIDVCIPRF